MKSWMCMPVLLASLSFSGCGGGSASRTTPPPSTYTIGGTVSGLAGTGLVLQDNGGDNLPVSANGGFTFPTPLTSGSTYSVTVLTQPSSPPQTCMVTNGTGTASMNVTGVQISCSTVNYTIGGTVSGLSGGGLVLQDNAGDNLAVSPSQTTFTFATTIPSGGAYKVTILTQPSNPTQSCTVTNADGTATADVTSVQITCITTVGSGYTIGGTVTGLTGSGLVLQDNGGDNLAISPSQTTFTFATTIAIGGSYNVIVLTQPSTPAQNCMVSGGTGTASGNVTNVSLVCVGDWVWVNGSDTYDQPGVYGTIGISAQGNVPGARFGSVGWTDASGNFWLFGGYGYTGAGTIEYLNDLWTYSAGQWTWISGTDKANASGVYGTLGVAASSNTPGARQRAVTWSDSSGNLWLFGGAGFDSAGTLGSLNDLWKFNAGQWTWINGSNHANQSGVYGTQGVAAATNFPGARNYATAWVDKAGNLWLFGGTGYDSAGGYSSLNDLWRYSDGQWTWMSGANLVNQPGVYGTQGTAALSNAPGSRDGSAAWVDSSGDLWLFGGQGMDSIGAGGRLNDLWKYSANGWTWVGGSDTKFAFGIYGVQGLAASGNSPGSRESALSWTDASGNFWLFGGFGQGAAGNGGNTGELGDLWRYAAGQWTWMSGSALSGQTTAYGTLGIPDPANVPGGRDSSVGWIDGTGNLWLFGGADGVGDAFNDLWEYQR